jgi:hypothetical protein
MLEVDSHFVELGLWVNSARSHRIENTVTADSRISTLFVTLTTAKSVLVRKEMMLRNYVLNVIRTPNL